MSPDEAYLARLGVSRKHRKRRRQLRQAVARVEASAHAATEARWRHSIYAWLLQATALGGLALAAGKPLWALHVATAFGALAAIAAALTQRSCRLSHERCKMRVEFLERLSATMPSLGDYSGSAEVLNERFLYLLAAGWTLGFTASVLMLGHDSLAIGQAACELIAFTTAAWWLFDTQRPVCRGLAHLIARTG